MASLKDVDQLADDLERLVGELRSELRNGSVDFEKLIQVADQISERADGFAGTFATVNEALMNRLDEIRGAVSRSSQASTSSGSGSSSSESKTKSGSSS